MKLAGRFVVMMVTVVFVIAGVSYLLVRVQTRDTEKRIYDKARLFSSLLGTHLDRIAGENIAAYDDLQAATARIAEGHMSVREVGVVAPEGVVIASSDLEKIWKLLQEDDVVMVADVVSSGEARSQVRSAFDTEQVVHFMPVRAGKEGALTGVLRVVADFPTGQGGMVGSLRSNRSAYLRKEAAVFARMLSGGLQVAMERTEQNAGYLASLIDNMTADEEIEDIRLFSADLRMLGSGSSGRAAGFLATAETDSFRRAIETKTTITAGIRREGEDLVQVVSPVFLSSGGADPAGAVGITLSSKLVDRIAAGRRNVIVGMSLAIVVAFVVLVGFFFGRQVLRPLEELTRLAVRMGKGDLTARSGISSADEIGRLAIAFNTMAEDLEASHKQVESLNLQLQGRVDDVSEELRRKQEQLLESEKLAALGVLSSGIAHEINNPLGVVLGDTQMLLEKVQTEGALEDRAETGELLSAIERNAKRCSEIVRNLLRFARGGGVDMGEVRVADTLSRAMESVVFSEGGREVTVETDIAEDLPVLRANPVQIEQVFANIARNAVQSIDGKGTLRIEARRAPGGSGEDNGIEVSFWDTGSGIPEGERGKIFEPFYTTKEPGDGVGLGLSVSYGIVKAHGGDIAIESSPGKGTTITVTLSVEGRSDNGADPGS